MYGYINTKSWCLAPYLVFQPLWSPLSCHSFNLSWLVPVNQDKTLWLASRLLPLSCHCTDHCQLSQALSFITWGLLLLCCMEWDSPLIISCILILQQPFLFFSCFWWYFMNLLLVFHKLLEWSWHFTLEMDVWSHLITNIKNLLWLCVCAWKTLQFIPYVTEFAELLT
jgi:hypothetical protein